jgi:hypothetical protein
MGLLVSLPWSSRVLGALNLAPLQTKGEALAC